MGCKLLTPKTNDSVTLRVGFSIGKPRTGRCWYICTWNLFVLYFGVSTLQNTSLSIQNKGHLGSRYVYIYIGLPFNPGSQLGK